MAQLRQDYEQITALGAEIIAICPEARGAVREYWEAEHLPFVGVPDPGHEIATAYGQRSSLLKLGRLPAMVLIDHAGIIRGAHYGDSMQDIPSTRMLVNWLEQLGVAVT
jgi:peroxiredoxin